MISKAISVLGLCVLMTFVNKGIAQVDFHFPFINDGSINYLDENLNWIINKSKSLNKHLVYRNSFTHQMDSIYYWNDDDYDEQYYLGARSELVYEKNKVTYLNSMVDVNLELAPDNFYVYEYNEDGQLVRYTNNPWDGDNNNIEVVDPSLSQVIIYNGNGLIEEVYLQDNFDFHMNRPSNLTVYTYDENNLVLIQSSIRDSPGDTLRPASEFEYFYDQQDRLTYYLRNANHRTRGWEQRDSVVYMYNPDGILFKVENYGRLLADAIWYPVNFVEFNYNSDSTIDYIRDFESFDNNADDWRVKLTHRYEYASSGDLVEIVTRADGEMYARRVENYEHDFSIIDNNVFKPPILFNDEDKPHVHAVTRDYEWKEGQWGPQQRYRDYFYSERESTSIDEDFESNSIAVNVFPNPTMSAIEIAIDENHPFVDIEIFDVNGKQVLTTRVKSGEIVDVSFLETGIYFCKVLIDEGSQAIRLVKL